MQDSSSDSDYEDFDSNYGPTTRRAWSDWCSNKGKSSQSEEEGNTKVCAYKVIALGLHTYALMRSLYRFFFLTK